MQHEQTDWIAQVVAELPPICNVVEAYTVLRTTRRNIHRLVASGRLHAVRPAAGGSARLLVPRASIEQYLRRLEGEAA